MHSERWAELFPWEVRRAAGTPLFRQIYAQIRSALLSGAFGAGAKLPSSRAMATSLGVARASVVAAYEQLLIEGYAEARAAPGPLLPPASDA
jgi:GntR family transcriptional regulator / MocR family aminotransferase